ncbi:MAG: 6-bladed beta-propeller [Candidatus Aminicenantes bacterium]|nr:6-bladed beta-propeller [Candidatus Aminicenantes bacterium]
MDYKISSTDKFGNYILNKPSMILLDKQDNLYVLDPPEGNIKIFDTGGRFLKTIGRKGQGPGELNVPSLICIINEEILIEDTGNRNIIILDLNGAYKRSISTASMTIKHIECDSNGNFFCIVQTREDDYFRYDLQKLDLSLSPIETFRQDEDHIAIKPSFFVASPHLVLSIDGRIIYGFPEKNYEFDIFDENGKLLNRIQKDFVGRKIPSEEIVDLMRNKPKSFEIYIPKYYPPFLSINSDDEGRIIVLSQYQYRTKVSTFDVFMPDGKYLTKLNLQNLERPEYCLWRKNRLYTFEEDSDGLPVVGVFQVQWKY